MFKVKNLMIDVVSAEVADFADQWCFFPTDHCDFNSLICPRFTGCINRSCLLTNNCENTLIGCIRGSCFLSDGCGLNYSTCFQTDLFIIDVKRLVINPDDIKHVNRQIDELLKAVEVRGAQLQDTAGPQTIEQVEFLENQLKAALEELQVRKKNLK